MIKKTLLSVAVAALLVSMTACRSGMTLTRQLEKMPTKAMLVSEAEARGVTLDTMETIYPNGLQFFGDSVPNAYWQSWADFCTGLVKELGDAGMAWNEPYRLWGRVYFSPDGKVEHYFYKWTGQLIPTEEWQVQFKEVLERYLAQFQFTYPMNRRFSQCGRVRVAPNK